MKTTPQIFGVSVALIIFAVCPIAGECQTAHTKQRSPSWEEVYALAQKVWGKPYHRDPRFDFRNFHAFCHRTLDAQEKRLISSLLEIGKSPESKERYSALRLLGVHPHVMMVDGLADVTRESPGSDHARKRVVQTAVISLARIADKRVIPHLIEALGHPHPDVRLDASFKVRGLIRLPRRYYAGGPVNFNFAKIEDAAERERIVKDLKEWWEQNQHKIQPRWGSAWLER